MTERNRPILTAAEVIEHLSKVPGDTPIYLAPCVVNEDEPEETQEFILSDKGIPCVAIEFPLSYERATLGWASKE